MPAKHKECLAEITAARTSQLAQRTYERLHGFNALSIYDPDCLGAHHGDVDLTLKLVDVCLGLHAEAEGERKLGRIPQRSR